MNKSEYRWVILVRPHTSIRINITADGHVPLSYKLFDGNTPDDVTHIPNWNALRTLLEKEDFIYVADCKLCSHKNLV
ncbi:MAG: hypothetical protein PF482_03295 [Desulfobacteraceae bacterium]|nr:hypothetical protein [Desulfobacteraceae bacterium]